MRRHIDPPVIQTIGDDRKGRHAKDGAYNHLPGVPRLGRLGGCHAEHDRSARQY